MQIFFQKFLKIYPPQNCEEFFCDSNGGLRLVFGLKTQREIEFEDGNTPKIQTLIFFLNMLVTERLIHFSSYANIQRVIFNFSTHLRITNLLKRLKFFQIKRLLECLITFRPSRPSVA